MESVKSRVVESARTGAGDSDLTARVQSETRKALAAELHDGVKQRLCALKYSMEANAGLESPAVSELLDQWIVQLGAAMTDLRDICRGLSPAEDARAFASELTTLVRSSPLNTEIEIDGNMVRVPANVRHSVFRIVQEALNNSLTHAGASGAWVRLKVADTIQLQFQDDGCGFEFETCCKPGHGLANMQSRTLQTGGTFNVGRGTGDGGAQIRCAWPLSTQGV